MSLLLLEVPERARAGMRRFFARSGRPSEMSLEQMFETTVYDAPNDALLLIDGRVMLLRRLP